MIDLNNIGYMAEIEQDYSRKLGQVTTLEGLKQLMDEYMPLVADAKAVVDKLNSVIFPKCLEEMDRVRRVRGKVISVANPDIYVVLLPKILLDVALVATKYCVPWGTAFKQMQSAGVLE